MTEDELAKACAQRMWSQDTASQNLGMNLERVEAGAQGQHKVQRGYLPRITYSGHWISDPGFRNAVARFIEEERRMVELEGQDLIEASPFRKDCS